MAGHDLKEGKLKIPKGKDANKQLWVVIASLFSTKSKKNTTYKFVFLKSILDNLYNSKRTAEGMKIEFNDLFRKFAEISWNIVVLYGLHSRKPTADGSLSAVERAILQLSEEYKVPKNGIRFENLSKEKQDEITNAITQQAKKYVVGAVYADTKGMFYSFSKKEPYLCIGHKMYKILCEHKIVLEKANYFEWAKFLESINKNNNTDKLLNHLDESGKRKNLKVYRDILYEEFEQRNCFYCGKKLLIDYAEVDHFIPWSFVKNDNLWNFVLSCKKCNRQKRDRLPSIKYLHRIEKRNIKLYIESNEPYNKGLIERIYQFAVDNGYNDYWEKTMIHNK